jgi:hypothetical protein
MVRYADLDRGPGVGATKPDEEEAFSGGSIASGTVLAALADCRRLARRQLSFGAIGHYLVSFVNCPRFEQGE